MIKEIIKHGEAEVTYKNKQLLSQKPKLKNLFWETTLRCNAYCKHCGSRAGGNTKFEGELTTKEIEKTLQEIADKYDAREILINVTGGEPLLQPNFLIQLFTKMNEEKICTASDTSGIVEITEDIKELLK